jgi:uncharacterized NAD-dependent epimerase/dehydratase family protein
MQGRAVVLAPGAFASDRAKTAHGLVRGSDRFEVVAVVDAASAGRDAGEVLDGRRRGIPILASLAEALGSQAAPDTCVVGVAMGGGFMPPEVRVLLIEAAQAGLTLVNGLHELCSEDPQISAAAARGGARILDLRRPRPIKELRFWTGEIANVRAPRLALLGTDCAVGKRTTARMLVQACRDQGLRAEMVYTGQTGWMQGARWGFILDATPNDFVAGELEGAVVACDREARPDVIIIEGQSSLRNPSGPCGAELLVSAGSRAAILQHAPGRPCFKGHAGWEVPSLLQELELIQLYGAQVLAVTLNGDNRSPADIESDKKRLAARLGVPVVAPLADGVSALVPLVRRYLDQSVAQLDYKTAATEPPAPTRVP